VVLHDDHNRIVENENCSADDFSTDSLDIVDILSSSESGVVLRPGEIYGREISYDIVKKRGVYRIQAELAPAHFTDKQKELLAQRHMRVLNSICLTPTVTITVK
jgi:hypothetical protein